MKRVATALLATAPLLLPATPARAQATFALTGGINHASIAVTEGGRDLVNRSVSRASIGLAAGIPISERLGLHLGGSYSQKGASVRQTGGIPSYDAMMCIDYIELSALAKATGAWVARGGPGAFACGPRRCHENSLRVAHHDDAAGYDPGQPTGLPGNHQHHPSTSG